MITCQNCKALNYDDMAYCFACRRPMYPLPSHRDEELSLDGHSCISDAMTQDTGALRCDAALRDPVPRTSTSSLQCHGPEGKIAGEDGSITAGTEFTIGHLVEVKPHKNQPYGYVPSKRSVLVGNSGRCDIVLSELTRDKEVARIYLEHTYALVEQIDTQTTLVVAGEPATGITFTQLGEPIYVGKSSLTCKQLKAA